MVPLVVNVKTSNSKAWSNSGIFGDFRNYWVWRFQVGKRQTHLKIGKRQTQVLFSSNQGKIGKRQTQIGKRQTQIGKR